MAVAQGATNGLVEPDAAVEEILRSAWKISAIVRDTLRLVQDGEQTFEPADVSGLIQEAVEELRQMAAARRIVLRVVGKPVLTMILVNRGLIVVALTDLIRNAIEAMEHGGTVTIQAERDAIAERVRITVTDSGPGIAADILDQVTLPQFTTKDGGTGLGLAVAKRIVESHFGRLLIGSGNGSGAVVTIELPDSPESIANLDSSPESK
jgi:two-component system sensor histidine kinase HydH